jgi:hypothetical protein
MRAAFPLEWLMRHGVARSFASLLMNRRKKSFASEPANADIKRPPQEMKVQTFRYWAD